MIIATGTASGKSLAYQVPALSSVLDGGTALYLTPTKALAADQLRALEALDVPGLRAAAYDGDTPYEERAWIRRHANYVLTNPDMLHRGLLPGHARWSGFWRRLRTVVVDECHGYRGVFGSHVAQILRRLRRICARYGSSPVFVLASATASDPGAFAMRLTGLQAAEVTMDASPRGSITFALWEPPLTDLRGERGAPVRRPAPAETADLLADLVLGGTRTLAFVRSRRAAESVALSARARLSDLASGMVSHRPPSSSRTTSAVPRPGRTPRTSTTSHPERTPRIPTTSRRERTSTTSHSERTRPAPHPGRTRRPRPARPPRPPRRSPRTSRICPARSPPTGPDTSPRSAEDWNGRCGRGTSSDWPRPMPWNSVSTCRDWTPSSSRGGRAPGRRCGSRPDGRAARARTRWPC